MAPPNVYARLNKINPEQLGKEVSQAVRDHIHSLAFHVGMSAKEDGPDQIGFSVTNLAHYAVHGGKLDAPVEEYLLSIAPSVWMRAYERGHFTTPEFDSADPDTLDKDEWQGQLILVMRAALAREQFDLGRPLSPADVAILASMSAIAVRALCRDGKLDARMVDEAWEVDASVARAFIAKQEAKRV